MIPVMMAYENMRPIEPDLGNPNYLLDHDLADKAIARMQMQEAGLREHAQKLKQDCGGSQFAARPFRQYAPGRDLLLPVPVV
jgi:hypothetical protein